MQDGAANANRRARVSKDEDERAYSRSCFETHRSASGVETGALASRCDAPQHEGKGGRPMNASDNATPTCSGMRSIVSGLLLQ